MICVLGYILLDDVDQAAVFFLYVCGIAFGIGTEFPVVPVKRIVIVNYETIQLQSGNQVSGGAEEKLASQDGSATWHISLKNARAFGLSLTRKLTAYPRETASGVQLTAYANTTSGAKIALDAAESAL